MHGGLARGEGGMEDGCEMGDSARAPDRRTLRTSQLSDCAAEGRGDTGGHDGDGWMERGRE